MSRTDRLSNDSRRYGGPSNRLISFLVRSGLGAIRAGGRSSVCPFVVLGGAVVGFVPSLRMRRATVLDEMIGTYDSAVPDSNPSVS